MSRGAASSRQGRFGMLTGQLWRDGGVIWEKTAQRIISTTGAGHLGQASADAVKEIMHELFA